MERNHRNHIYIFSTSECIEKSVLLQWKSSKVQVAQVNHVRWRSVLHMMTWWKFWAATYGSYGSCQVIDSPQIALHSCCKMRFWRLTSYYFILYHVILHFIHFYPTCTWYVKKQKTASSRVKTPVSPEGKDPHRTGRKLDLLVQKGPAKAAVKNNQSTRSTQLNLSALNSEKPEDLKIWEKKVLIRQQTTF